MTSKGLVKKKIRAESEIKVFEEGGCGKFYLISDYIAALEAMVWQNCKKNWATWNSRRNGGGNHNLPHRPPTAAKDEAKP